MIVLATCGKQKLDRPAPAGELYIGRYARACLDYALELAPALCVYIISAWYGLLELGQVVEPYELRLGQRGCIGEYELRWQAAKLGLLGEQAVALGGRDYTKLCQSVWPSCTTPLQEIDGGCGIGSQLSWLSRETRRLRASRSEGA